MLLIPVLQALFLSTQDLMRPTSIRFITAALSSRSRLGGSSRSRLRTASSLSDSDRHYMQQAVECAQLGFGHTFPNPAVGCVLVAQRQDGNDESETVLGRGFHPRAGFPHAEVFALFQAAGHVMDGVEAALDVLKNRPGPTLERVKELSKLYATPEGPQQLFGNLLGSANNMTAYVTLEPCCHYGQTPPCAATLALTQVVTRVVVGFRDPNPRVNGGGVRLLEEAGIDVQIFSNDDKQEDSIHQACADLVTNFCKRIAPRNEEDADWRQRINGQARSALRSLANSRKAAKALPTIAWEGDSVKDLAGDLETAIQELYLNPTWIEQVDDLLWKNELILLRLNQAVAKKKGALLLGNRIADQLGAHVAQTVGHTSLLYRPGVPAVLDLEQLVQEKNQPS